MLPGHATPCLDGLSLAASYAMVRELGTDEINTATFMPATIEGAIIFNRQVAVT